jgi:hypothetical protein
MKEKTIVHNNCIVGHLLEPNVMYGNILLLLLLFPKVWWSQTQTIHLPTSKNFTTKNLKIPKLVLLHHQTLNPNQTLNPKP